MNRQEGEGHLKTEAEIRGMLPQAKDPERAGRGNETFSLEPLEVVWLWQYLDFCPPELWKDNTCYVCSNLFQQPQETNTMGIIYSSASQM